MTEESMIQLASSVIRRFEGFRAKPYQCPGGKKTVGWGHVITEDEKDIDEVTEEYGAALLARDIKNVVSLLQSYSFWGSLKHNQKAALISFVFNVGIRAFEKSTMRARLSKGLVLGAGGEFTRFIFSRGTIYRGLIRRRLCEQILYLVGHYEDREVQ